MMFDNNQCLNATNTTCSSLAKRSSTIKCLEKAGVANAQLRLIARVEYILAHQLWEISDSVVYM